MKHKILSLLAMSLSVLFLASCGTDPEIMTFMQDLEDFCTAVSDLNESINHIDAEADNAAALALDYLDRLDDQFQDFAALDFPEEFDYLESLADEAGEYMKEAVESYHQAYANDDYDADTAAYARENSARAFKRIQIILQVMRGEDPTETSDGE